MNCTKCGGSVRERLLRVRGALTAAAGILFLALAFLLVGDLLHDLAEGIRRDRLPLWKLWLTLAALLGFVVAVRGRWRRPLCDACGAGASPMLTPLSAAQEQRAQARGPSRRVVLRLLGTGGTTVAAAAGGLAVVIGRRRDWLPVAKEFFGTEVETTAPHPRPEWNDSRIRSYRRLGRTNALVSDISLGSGRIRDVEVARAALDRGVNYFDTAPDYAQTGSERVLGEAMKGRRDKVFLATKFCVGDGHLRNDTPVPEVMEAVNASLQRLQTDYVDLVHIHACDRIDRLMAPNIHEAFDRLKEQGKVRFLGVSTHTPNLEQVANAAIDSGRFDVMMLAYHFGMWRGLEDILAKAKANDVGVVAMKTLKGAKHTNLTAFRDEASAYSQAAFRWVLSNPNVSCLVISFSKPQHVDEYLYASGQSPRPEDVATLRRYDQLVAGDYCQPHCGDCLAACPYGLPINDVLRHRMYFRDYGSEKEGVQLYAKLPRNAASCLDCSAPCAGTCPIGVPIREKMLDAHELLTLTV